VTSNDKTVEEQLMGNMVTHREEMEGADLYSGEINLAEF
jgi:hypothetical protein